MTNTQTVTNHSSETQIENVNFSNWRTMMTNQFSAIDMMVDFVKYPVMTEKTYRMLLKNRQYTFDVDLRLTKSQIKKLFEQLFKVNIIGMNTHRPPRQKRGSKGYKSRYKRVILTLKEGQSLSFDQL